jgi:hypothetical protein
MRGWLLVLGVVAMPVSGEAAPHLPAGFATERFTPIESLGKLPPPLRQALDRYIRFQSLGDAGAQQLDGTCRPGHRRLLAGAGVGRALDFVVYEHLNHDHLLVYRHGAHGARALAFSCSGDLPRKPGLLTKAVLQGRCREKTGPVEIQ